MQRCWRFSRYAMENQRHRIKKWLVVLFLSAIDLQCRGDAFIIAPTPTGPEAETFVPFFLQQVRLTSMRYQQVYNASVFSSVPPECIYVTTLTFFQGFSQKGSTLLTITSMEINLSTTQRAADNLSTNFAENVGADETIVFGPARHDFNDVISDRFPILLDRPFRYNPATGNLLLDVRVFNGAGPVAMNLPRLEAFNSSTDESSRVWATNVTAVVADGADTTGLDTVMQFSAIPGLQIYQTTEQGTNIIVVRWPAQPSAFALQNSDSLSADALWQPIANYDRASSTNTLVAPLKALGKTGFYRLFWETGQRIQPATAPG